MCIYLLEVRFPSKPLEYPTTKRCRPMIVVCVCESFPPSTSIAMPQDLETSICGLRTGREPCIKNYPYRGNLVSKLNCGEMPHDHEILHRPRMTRSKNTNENDAPTAISGERKRLLPKQQKTPYRATSRQTLRRNCCAATRSECDHVTINSNIILTPVPGRLHVRIRLNRTGRGR